MQTVWALCLKEWLLLSRDRHGLLVLFAVPALFILIMSLALRDAFAPVARIALPVVVVDDDGGRLAQQFVRTLGAQQGVKLGAQADAAKLHLLKGFSELLATRAEFAQDYLEGQQEPQLLRLEQAPSSPPQLRAATALMVRQSLLVTQADLLFADAEGGLDTQALHYLNDPARLPVQEAFTGSALTPNAAQQAVPAWLIFALFFAVIPLASAFVTEREQGSLARLRVIGVSPLQLLFGKLLPWYAVNLVQMAVMLAIGVWAVPLLGGDALQLGSSAAGLWLIGTATSICALGLALLVSAAARTTTQATLAGGATSLLLAALGGVMVPKLVMPPAMQAASQLSPMSWALEGYWDLLLRGGGLAQVLPESAALTLCGLLALSLAAALLRRGSV